MSKQSSQLHLLVIGGTGKTGRLLLVEALLRGYTITALARNPTSLDSLISDQILASQRPQLNVIKADPTSKCDMQAALASALSDAQSRSIIIISMLGQTRASGNPWSAATSPPMFMTQAAKALIATLATSPPSSKSRIEKLVLMSMFGAGNSFDNLHCLIKPVMKFSTMMQTVEDHNGVDVVIRNQNEVKWIMVRPSMLKDGLAAPVKVREENGKGEGWIPSSITTSSVVEFIFGCVVKSEWDGKAAVITN